MLLLILLCFVMFFFCLYFYYQNKKLAKKTNELELEIKNILERKLTKNKDDIISIETISIETKTKPTNTNQKKEHKPTKKQNQPSISKKYIAKRNNIEEYQKPNIVSPTTTNLKTSSKKENTVNQINKKNKITKVNNVSLYKNFNPNEFIKSNNKPEHNKAKKDNDEYLKNISKQIAKELTPQTIELTDYERVQEEEAVISYQELLSLKEKNNFDTFKEDNFIEDLKEFRKMLD